MYCLNCGKQLPANAKFCNHCGTKQNVSDTENSVSESQSMATPQPNQNQQPVQMNAQFNKPPKKKRKIFAVLAVIVCFSLVAVFLAQYFFKSDEQLINERIDKFLNAYNSGDMSGVVSCFDAKTRNQFQGILNIGNALIGGSTGFGINISDLFGISVGSVSDEDILKATDRVITFKSDSLATVTITLSYKDNYSSMSDKAVLTMVKEGRDWFIKTFKEQKD